MNTFATDNFPGVGIHYDMPAHIYHSVDACSASDLKTLAQSAKHLWVRKHTPFEPSDAMLLGTATHTATLEPDKLEGSILVSETCCAVKADGGKCSNAGRVLSGGRWYCGVHGKKYTPDPLPKLLDEEENLITTPVVTEAAYQKALAMARAVRADRAARRILESPTARMEVSFFWIEKVALTLNGNNETFDVPCKMRADIYDPAFPVLGPLISDLKTCQCAARPDFEDDIAKRRYDIQAAWYLDGATKAAGGELHQWFKFIAIESAVEHCVGVYRCHPELLMYGRMTALELLSIYTLCRATNRWPGYHDHQLKECNLPPWFIRQEEREFKRVDFK